MDIPTEAAHSGFKSKVLTAIPKLLDDACRSLAYRVPALGQHTLVLQGPRLVESESLPNLFPKKEP